MKFVKLHFKFEKQYRLSGWDYSRSGLYFVTICTKDRVNFLGKINQGKIELSEIGKLTKKFWLEIPSRFKNIYLDNFCVMPNHVHGIIICRNRPRPVPTIGAETYYQNVPINSISTVINHFKGYVTKECKINSITFSWQSRFHDRLIRNEREYFAIKQYIKDNPKNWLKDKEYSYV